VVVVSLLRLDPVPLRRKALCEKELCPKLGLKFEKMKEIAAILFQLSKIIEKCPHTLPSPTSAFKKESFQEGEKEEALPWEKVSLCLQRQGLASNKEVG